MEGHRGCFVGLSEKATFMVKAHKGLGYREYMSSGIPKLRNFSDMPYPPKVTLRRIDFCYSLLRLLTFNNPLKPMILLSRSDNHTEIGHREAKLWLFTSQIDIL